MEQNNLTECMCEFCGQVLQADDETMRRAKQDTRTAAKLICECAEAKIFSRRYTITEKGIEMIDNICGRRSGNPLKDRTVYILHEAVSEIAKNSITGITVNVSAKEKVKVEYGSKGIKCNRTVTETDVDECRF